ncbi:MAG TPA: glycerol-3-phosphate 1-O-acyltransferase PlsY [Verrucomicrobiae bacterium]|nr:glycerol-3-phosphate 1-O-acyltransferase PlsY [Verrucomicrobiae bacterium]
MQIVTALLVSYLLGAIPFAYMAGKYKGLDIRKHGSGNMGTTNAFRVLGKKLGLLVFVGDFVKGMLAAQVGLSAGGEAWGPWLAILTGILSLLGHSWNPFFGFKPTGKGVAAGAGVIMRLMPLPTLITLSAFFIVTFVSGYVSLGSIVGGVFAVLTSILLQNEKAYILFAVAGAALVIIRHRENIKRIRSGKEPRVNWNKKL